MRLPNSATAESSDDSLESPETEPVRCPTGALMEPPNRPTGALSEPWVFVKGLAEIVPSIGRDDTLGFPFYESCVVASSSTRAI